VDYCLAHTGIEAVNLETGNGYSVLQIVKAFEKASGRTIKYQIVGRMEGDIDVCFADASKAKRLFGSEAKLDIDRMCVDTWMFNEKAPHRLWKRSGFHKMELFSLNFHHICLSSWANLTSTRRSSPKNLRNAQLCFQRTIVHLKWAMLISRMDKGRWKNELSTITIHRAEVYFRINLEQSLLLFI
jgi:hypothetical protein